MYSTLGASEESRETGFISKESMALLVLLASIRAVLYINMSCYMQG